MKKPVPILVRVPPSLLKKIERSAKTVSRSRNAEIVVRLEEAFKREKDAVGA